MCDPDPGLCKGRTPCTLEKQYVSMNREQQFKNQMSSGCISLVALVSNWKNIKTWEEGIFNAQIFLQCRKIRRHFHMTAPISYYFFLFFFSIPAYRRNFHMRGKSPSSEILNSCFQNSSTLEMLQFSKFRMAVFEIIISSHAALLTEDSFL